MKHTILAAALACALTAGPATAYTSYLLPEEFFTVEDEITAQGAFAQQFFTPAVATAGDNVYILNPTGTRSTPDRLEVQPTIMRLTTDLPRGGTYRLSTGEQIGPVSTLVGDGGGWRPMVDGEVLEEGTPVTTLQAVTLAEAYVTRGTPTRTAIDDNLTGRLSIRPVTHPNQVLAAQGMDVQVLFDGAPLPNLAVVLYTAGEADTQVDRYSVTDAQGNARFTFDRPGQYLIAARHRAPAPEGSEAEVRSYTTTLTVEALATLPRNVEIRTPGERRSRRRDR
ncbi:MAG: DUF4198 domain-containing protein [Hyphomonadaceae bacterium]